MRIVLDSPDPSDGSAGTAAGAAKARARRHLRVGPSALQERLVTVALAVVILGALAFVGWWFVKPRAGHTVKVNAASGPGSLKHMAPMRGTAGPLIRTPGAHSGRVALPPASRGATHFGSGYRAGAGQETGDLPEGIH
ncbi:MAG: hypothetical protein IT208_17545 [Chthonomonadales bacterium]|nr:hypothetical protein [Chthonomonadales bacterium]